MNINTYELVLDNDTKHCSLRLKESLPYKGEYLSEPSKIAEMMKEIFHIDEMADEFTSSAALLRAVNKFGTQCKNMKGAFA